jgi:PHD/YefM family antitoxin component YafN of YafNO toxin-antitoxin module
MPNRAFSAWRRADHPAGSTGPCDDFAVIQIAADRTGQLADLLAAGLADGPVEVTLDGAPVAVVLSPGEFGAMQETQQFLATNGALACVAEGLADLAAGRADDWVKLREDYARAELDASATSATTLVSHRARWDLDLLPPPVAEHCFALLDSASQAGAPFLGRRLTAGFPELNLAVADGYRMVLRITADGIEVIHIDTAP